MSPSTQAEQAIGLTAALDVERWLADHKVKHAPVRMFRLDQIDEKESRRNQVRAEAIIPEAVERYAVRFKAGEMCPPLVAYKRSSRLVLIDGNNRHAAAKKASVQEVPVIVIDAGTSSEVIVLLMTEANSQHGIPTEQGWRDQQALNMIDVGWSIEQAAASTGLTKTGVEVALRVRDIDERAIRLGIRGWAELSKTARSALGALKADPVFQAASRMVIETEMGSGTPLAGFVRDVRLQPSEQDALQFIGATTEERMGERKRLQVAGRRRVPSPKHEVLSALGALCALKDKRYLASIPIWFITPEDRKEVRQRVDAAVNVLAEIEANLDESPPVAP